MTSVALILVLSACVQNDVEPFYKFNKDTTWTLEGNDKTKILMKVVKQENGKVFVETKRFSDDSQEPSAKSACWFVKDGFLCIARMKDGETQDTIRLLKVGSKKGDSWPASELKGAKGQIFHMGTVEVKVTAGTFKDATQIRITDSGTTVDYYLAPKVGIVKLEETRESDKTTFELKEFVEAK